MFDKIEKMDFLMRDERRIKKGTDWNYVVNYQELHILCSPIYRGVIEEYAKKFDLKVEKYHCF